jgi:glycerol-3-phosphate acyltransferase PlsY
LITALLGYAFGCLQFSYILGKTLKKVDIRTLGHGNAGASNAVVSLGWKYGIAVALLDIFKALASVLITKALFKNVVNPEQLNFYLYLNGFFVIIGHNYPFFMRFKGGKGTASLVGMLLATNIPMALLGMLIIISITLATDYIALGTIVLVVYFVIAVIYLKSGVGAVVISILIAVLAIINHLPNIRRIINKDEKGLRQSLKRK